MTDPLPIDPHSGAAAPHGGSAVHVRASPVARAASAVSWRGVADAVGYSLLVFTCVPPLAILPAWLLREAGEPLNREMLLVLAFLPVRGVNLLLNAFARGVVQGTLAGGLTGGLLCAWSWWRQGKDAPRWSARMLGAIAGAVAAALGVAVTVALDWVEPGGVPTAVVAFEIGLGAVCGLLAGPRAIALAHGASGAGPAGEPSR